jgi:hypothetical protein
VTVDRGTSNRECISRATRALAASPLACDCTRRGSPMPHRRTFAPALRAFAQRVRHGGQLTWSSNVSCGSGPPTPSRRTLATVILTFARSEVSALSPSWLRWPPTPARGDGRPLANTNWLSDVVPTSPSDWLHGGHSYARGPKGATSTPLRSLRPATSTSRTDRSAVQPRRIDATPAPAGGARQEKMARCHVFRDVSAGSAAAR